MSPSVIAVAGASAPDGISLRSLAGSTQLTWPAASARTAASGCGVGLLIATPESPVETGCVVVPASVAVMAGASMAPAEQAPRPRATRRATTGRKGLIQ